MKNSVLSFAITIALAASCFAQATKTNQASAEKAVTAAEQAWADADVKGDSKALAKLMADDMTDTSWDGTTTNKSTPVAVAGGLTFTAISAGGNHTCGTTSTGAAYCWGSNTHSEVGDGTIVNRLAPVRVMNPR